MSDSLTGGSPETTARLSAPEIAEGILGSIDWISDTEGYCECPGKNRHTTKEGEHDCMVYLDHIPTLYCVHANCKSAIDEANRRLRSAILNGTGTEQTKRRLTAEDKVKLQEREKRERIRLRAKKALPQLLARYNWPYATIISDSPVNVVGDEKDHWSLLLEKFKPDDVVWIGDKFHSGKPEHANHFKSVIEWLNTGDASGPFICPATFKNNSYARSNESILERRFLVVESDVLTKDEVGAVFKWLRDVCGLDLVAIVDTAGKSLHGWFRYPEYEDEVEDLKLVLPAYGCDPKLFTPSQPVRLPGALRDSKYQKLVYLSQEVAHE